jgi:hypothetical protein
MVVRPNLVGGPGTQPGHDRGPNRAGGLLNPIGNVAQGSGYIPSARGFTPGGVHVPLGKSSGANGENSGTSNPKILNSGSGLRLRSHSSAGNSNVPQRVQNHPNAKHDHHDPKDDQIHPNDDASRPRSAAADTKTGNGGSDPRNGSSAGRSTASQKRGVRAVPTGRSASRGRNGGRNGSPNHITNGHNAMDEDGVSLGLAPQQQGPFASMGQFRIVKELYQSGTSCVYLAEVIQPMDASKNCIIAERAASIWRRSFNRWTRVRTVS